MPTNPTNPSKIRPLDTKPLPKALSIKKLIGPSFIILGLGLGSGEVVLWPYLTSKYGMGIIWAAIVGITLQFFMNMEIERYALVRGESIFVGFARKFKYLPLWFLFSTFVPWIWPGIIASAAKLFGSLLGVSDSKSHFIAIVLLIVIGLILSLGPVLYKTVERFQKVLIFIGVPTIFALALLLASKSDYIALAQGVIGIGDGYTFLPEGIVLASFLAALAYAGAGGNLNLAQSFFIKEKGYGMGKYAGRITSLLTGREEKVSITGAKFNLDVESLATFKTWWRNINIEHFIVFWLTGTVTILLLGLLSFTTVFGTAGDTTGIGFLFLEAQQIGIRVFPFAATFFLIIAGLTLFSTQLGVFDATSRILTENLLLLSPETADSKNVPKTYYIVLWLQILAGILIFLLGFTEPLQLLILAAVLNAFAMFIHTGITLWLNLTNLERAIRPKLFRIAMMIIAFVFYGSFSAYTIIDKFF